MTAINENGPASVGALPDRGSLILGKGIQNMETNTTGASPAPAPVEQLVAEHICAVAEHDRRFQLEDWGLMDHATVFAAIDPIDKAFEAICAARPADREGIELRRAYLIAFLPDYVDENKHRLVTALEALLDHAKDLEVARS